MRLSNKEINKKRGRPVTTGSGKPVMIRFHPDQLDDIGEWIALQDEPVTLPEAIRRLALAAARRAVAKLQKHAHKS